MSVTKIPTKKTNRYQYNALINTTIYVFDITFVYAANVNKTAKGGTITGDTGNMRTRTEHT